MAAMAGQQSQSVETSANAVVRIGSRVRMRDCDDEEEFRVVDPGDADPVMARVSAMSPLGRALLGHRIGDEVRFRAPGGVLSVTIVEVSD